MRALNFGRTSQHEGACLVLIVSVRTPRQLMEHDELLQIQKEFPENFRYHPVLTREWPDDWEYTKGRMIRAQTSSGGEELIDLSPLIDVVGDIKSYHVRICGGRVVHDQLVRGFQQKDLAPLSLRAEVW